MKDAIVDQPERTDCFVQVIISDGSRSLVDSLLVKGVAVRAIEIAFSGLSSESFIHPARLLTIINASVHVQHCSKAASIGSIDCDPMQKKLNLISIV